MSFGFPLRNGAPVGLATIASLGKQAAPPAPPPAASYLLLESSDFILLEDGTSKIELE